jgi:aspartyl-tRNA(Asn)/glutamyl-tRNA(Gln) amidotransferase subunit A
MANDELCWLSATGLAGLIRKKQGLAVQPYAWVPFTYPFNMTGQPAASVPAGFTRDGLPIGLQIVGRRFDDAGVLRAAAAFERARPWADRRPSEP